MRFTAGELAAFRELAGDRPISHLVRELATRPVPKPFRMATNTVTVTRQPQGWIMCNTSDVQTGMRPMFVVRGAA